MATYTGVADANGDFTISFGTDSYTGGQKVIVTAEKDSATKSIELHAPSEVVGGGVIQFSGNLTNFPVNIGIITLSQISGVINQYAFAAPTNVNSIFQKAKGLVVNEGVTSVGENSFATWGEAKSISLPSSLISIKNNAFISWGACTSLVIPNSVTSIESRAFYGWYSCLSVVIGSSVSSIASEGFNGLTSCNTITCLPQSPPAIQSATFASLKSTCIFKVPAESVAAYQAAANWSTFAARIQAI